MTSALLPPPDRSTAATARRSASVAARERPVVCHPVWQFGYGGLERQLAQLLPLLESRFENVLFVRGDTDEARQPWPAGVRAVRDAPGGPFDAWCRRLARQMRRLNAALLHVRGLTALPDAVAAAQLAGRVPIVFSFHGVEASDVRFSWMRRRVLRAALRRCAARWCVSAAARERLSELIEWPRDAFDVIENGVDLAAHRPATPGERRAARERLGLPPDRTILLAVGNLKAIKGHAVLLDALRRCATAPDRLTTVLVGADYSGSELPGLRGQIAGHDVRLVGLQTDVCPWYHAADVFVLPSLWEGLSNALLEAMACGLPVIATAAGGTCDVASHEHDALLVPPGDAAALARAIDASVADPGGLRRRGDAARRTVEARFALPRTAERIAAVYAAAATARTEHCRGGDA